MYFAVQANNIKLLYFEVHVNKKFVGQDMATGLAFVFIAIEIGSESKFSLLVYCKNKLTKLFVDDLLGMIQYSLPLSFLDLQVNQHAFKRHINLVKA